ncbi:MAG: gamma-glutamyltransferase [Melioribacteraceae bacterium]|nr:gamma-glutamyltransferase [Melioribacteraceae bacterium]
MLRSVFSKYSLVLLLLLISSNQIKAQVAYGYNGIVVSASEEASQVGIDILKKGGNAIDAAVAIGFSLAVTYPSAGNIGGGGFMIIHLADGRNTTLDFREIAPSNLSEKLFQDDEGEIVPGRSLKTVLGTGVPGTVKGLLAALEKYGTYDREEILSSAIELAKNGFPLSYRNAESINYFNNEFNSFPSSKKLFTKNGDKFLLGDTLIQIDLANTLKIISEFGIDGFYKGEVANKLVKFINDNGGIISKEDLENYKVLEKTPITHDYKGFEIISMPPPSAGGIALVQAFKLFNKINFDSVKWNSSEYIYFVTEAFKYIYAYRNKYLGDPDFVNPQIEYLLSDEVTEKVFSDITNNRSTYNEIINGDNGIIESKETTHYSVVDGMGNAVSVTYTINSSYGNKIVAEGLGFLLNNEIDDFALSETEINQFGLPGSKANIIKPGKRMLSSMTPTIVLKNNKPYIVIGSPGGSTIITSVIQVISNILNYNMGIKDAITVPRFHHQWLPDELVFEEFGFSPETINRLKARGLVIGGREGLGRVEGILFNESKNIYTGLSDPRGFGKAIGY